METDARGQLGGLETTDAIRQRLATESTSYKCATCGKTNGEIIKECEERAQEASSTQQEVEIPKELKMGWRDELEAKDKTGPQDASDQQESSSELAEGFVQTTPRPTSNAAPIPVREAPPVTAEQSNQQARPRHQPPQQPRALDRNTHAPQPALAQPRRVQDDGVPLWIDRTIVVLVVVLAALILKLLFAV